MYKCKMDTDLAAIAVVIGGAFLGMSTLMVYDYGIGEYLALIGVLCAVFAALAGGAFAISRILKWLCHDKDG